MKKLINGKTSEITATIKANYWKMGGANVIHTDGRKSTFVMIIDYERCNKNDNPDRRNAPNKGDRI